MPSRSALALAFLAASLSACGSSADRPPEAVAHPPARLRPVPAGARSRAGTCPAPGGDQIHIVVAKSGHSRSWRPAFETCPDGGWEVPIDAGKGAVLEVSLARLAPRDDRRPTKASLEISDRAGRRQLWTSELPSGSGWLDRHIALPPGRATLRFRSTDPGAVAWSEPYLAPLETRDPRPNLVLVSLDTLRADHLGLYGYARATSPSLRKLAKDSLVFDHALSSSTWTLPSTATLLTGLLPAQHGAVSLHDALPAGVVTVAERLRAAGYRTAAFTDGGFLSFEMGLAQGFDRYDATWIDLRRITALYDGEVARVDHYLGIFWQTLRATGRRRSS